MININRALSVVYVMNDGECDQVYHFTFLDDISTYCPDYKECPDLYKAWQHYRDVMSKPLPPLETNHE